MCCAGWESQQNGKKISYLVNYSAGRVTKWRTPCEPYHLDKDVQVLISLSKRVIKMEVAGNDEDVASIKSFIRTIQVCSLIRQEQL